MGSTYPSHLLLPAASTHDQIVRAAGYRSHNRLPAITWCNTFNVTLSRSSQPKHKPKLRNTHDELLVQQLVEMNERSKTFVICDCGGPRSNAVANQYIEGYNAAHIIFFDIEDIHKMHKSIMSLKECCEHPHSDDWHKSLHDSQWLQHLSKILKCSHRCASIIDKDLTSVLVHRSDGWDRTAQV